MILERVAGQVVVVQQLRKPRWPDAKWLVYRGSKEATGPTKQDALYNYEREHGGENE